MPAFGPVCSHPIASLGNAAFGQSAVASLSGLTILYLPGSLISTLEHFGYAEDLPLGGSWGEEGGLSLSWTEQAPLSSGWTEEPSAT